MKRTFLSIKLLMVAGGLICASLKAVDCTVYTSRGQAYSACFEDNSNTDASRSNDEEDGAQGRLNTPLHVAALRGFADIVDELLAHGASADAQDSNGVTPVHVALAQEHDRIALALIKHARTAINSATAQGVTPLHLTAYDDNERLTELLLKLGAVVDAQDEDGDTPLHLAAQNGYQDIAKRLLEAGANVHAANKLGHTPLYYAALFGHYELVKLFQKERK
jgi:ankyrin repeat and protein kinase domain-containing protein 1